MIDTKSIRTKILDLAMRGQLTEQLPEDGTAEELYQQIQEEKQALIKAGKIKKEKPLPEITEGEKPFEIPKSWKWVYLGELFQHNTGKALNASDRQGELLEYITTSNLYWDRFELDDLKQMPFTENEIEKCTVKKGDLLVCEGGDIGRSAIWPFDYDMRIQNHIHRLRRYSSGIYTDFYYYLLWLYKQTGRINGIGIGLQGFSSKRVHSLIVPLAPYDESVRVVEIIKQAFSALVTIDELQTQYADNLVVLKTKLIDAAIQGKLTAQLPEDGIAEELYQQIQEEKQALIRAGKIKKEKPLPEIAENEIPFEIPTNWKWCRLGSISDKLTDGSHNPPPNTGEGYPVISAKNLINGLISFDNVERYTDETGFNKENPRTNITYGDIILGIIGGSIGKVGVYLHKEKVIAQRSIAIIHVLIEPAYLVSVLRSSFIQRFMQKAASGSAQGGIYLGTLSNLLIPLPPLAEQKRIVARLEEILPLCVKPN